VPEQAVLTLGWAVLGWLIGIGLNRLIYQIPRDRPALGQPTCEHCGASIAAIRLRWSTCCPSCGKPTGYDRVEWPLAVLFALFALWFGPTGSLLAHSLYLISLTLIAVIDLRHRFVYTMISLPTLIVALVASPTLAGLGLVPTILGCLLAAGVFLVFYVVGRIMYRGTEPMGTGDITIAAIIGAMVGFPRVISALFVGSLASALFGIGAVLVRRSGRRTFIPYGPGLCIGALVAFFVGP
jgi:leader peptidase (prepilin peptidase)/N-methyltransferase